MHFGAFPGIVYSVRVWVSFDFYTLLFQVNPAALTEERSCPGGILNVTIPLMINFATFLPSNLLPSQSTPSSNRFDCHPITKRQKMKDMWFPWKIEQFGLCLVCWSNMAFHKFLSCFYHKLKTLNKWCWKIKCQAPTLTVNVLFVFIEKAETHYIYFYSLYFFYILCLCVRREIVWVMRTCSSSWLRSRKLPLHRGESRQYQVCFSLVLRFYYINWGNSSTLKELSVKKKIMCNNDMSWWSFLLEEFLAKCSLFLESNHHHYVAKQQTDTKGSNCTRPRNIATHKPL